MAAFVSSKLSEYIVMGKAVIVARLKTIRHYFSEEALAYFEPQNAADLARVMFRLYSDPDRRRRLADTAIREYAPISWNVMKQRYLTLMADITGHRQVATETNALVAAPPLRRVAE